MTFRPLTRTEIREMWDSVEWVRMPDPACRSTADLPLEAQETLWAIMEHVHPGWRTLPHDEQQMLATLVLNAVLKRDFEQSIE